MRAWNPLPAARERQQARRFSLTALLAPLALAHAVAAEPIGPDAFGPDTDHIEFADFPSGTEISFQLSVHGARVRCASGPWLRVASAGPKPSPTPMLVAPAPGCTITASFLTPRRRVGLRLGPPMAATVATLTAFDAAGDPLDAVLAQLPGGGEGAFLGIGLPEPVIARVVLTASPEASLAVGALLAEPSQATGVGSLAALEAVFTSSQASEPLRIEALDAVRRSPSPQASALLQKALDDPARPYLQELAAEALAQMGDREALPAILAALSAAGDRELVLGLHNAAWRLRQLHPPADPPAVALDVEGALVPGEPFDVVARVTSNVAYDRAHLLLRGAKGLLRRPGTGPEAYAGALDAGETVVLRARYVSAPDAQGRVFTPILSMSFDDANGIRVPLYVELAATGGRASREPFPEIQEPTVHVLEAN